MTQRVRPWRAVHANRVQNRKPGATLGRDHKRRQEPEGDDLST